MKHCEDFLELISAYVDGELSETEVSELEAHLESCEDCRRTLEFYRELHSLEQESLVEPPAELHGSIMSAVKREKRKPFIRTLPALVSSLAACLVIAVGVGYFGGFGGSEETAGEDVMMYARMTDGGETGTERADETAPAGAPAAAAGMRVATTGAAESATAAQNESASYDTSAEDGGEAATYKSADTAAYDPNEPTESLYAIEGLSLDPAIEGLSLDPDVETGNATNDFTSSDETAPEEQGDGTVETTSFPAMFRLPDISVADAIVEGKIAIDADAVTDFSYGNRMYELGEDADAADMREMLDYFASLELTPLDEAPDVEELEPVGVTVWYGDTILVFVYYPEGYVVEDDRWYAFE